MWIRSGQSATIPISGGSPRVSNPTVVGSSGRFAVSQPSCNVDPLVPCPMGGYASATSCATIKRAPCGGTIPAGGGTVTRLLANGQVFGHASPMSYTRPLQQSSKAVVPLLAGSPLQNGYPSKPSARTQPLSSASTPQNRTACTVTWSKSLPSAPKPSESEPLQPFHHNEGTVAPVLATPVKFDPETPCTPTTIQWENGGSFIESSQPSPAANGPRRNHAILIAVELPSKDAEAALFDGSNNGAEEQEESVDMEPSPMHMHQQLYEQEQLLHQEEQPSEHQQQISPVEVQLVLQCPSILEVLRRFHDSIPRKQACVERVERVLNAAVWDRFLQVLSSADETGNDGKWEIMFHAPADALQLSRLQEEGFSEADVQQCGNSSGVCIYSDAASALLPGVMGDIKLLGVVLCDTAMTSSNVDPLMPSPMGGHEWLSPNFVEPDCLYLAYVIHYRLLSDAIPSPIVPLQQASESNQNDTAADMVDTTAQAIAQAIPPKPNSMTNGSANGLQVGLTASSSSQTRLGSKQRTLSREQSSPAELVTTSTAGQRSRRGNNMDLIDVENRTPTQRSFSARALDTCSSNQQSEMERSPRAGSKLAGSAPSLSLAAAFDNSAILSQLSPVSSFSSEQGTPLSCSSPKMIGRTVSDRSLGHLPTGLASSFSSRVRVTSASPGAGKGSDAPQWSPRRGQAWGSPKRKRAGGCGGGSAGVQLQQTYWPIVLQPADTQSWSPPRFRKAVGNRQKQRFKEECNMVVSAALRRLRVVDALTNNPSLVIRTVPLPAGTPEADAVIALYLRCGGKIRRPIDTKAGVPLSYFMEVRRVENIPLFREYCAQGDAQMKSWESDDGETESAEFSSPEKRCYERPSWRPEPPRKAIHTRALRLREHIVWHGARLKQGDGLSLTDKLRTLAETGFDPRRCTRGGDGARGGIWAASSPLAAFGRGADSKSGFILCITKSLSNEWVDTQCVRIADRERILPLYTLQDI